jgi:hypothetical protein
VTLRTISKAHYVDNLRFFEAVFENKHEQDLRFIHEDACEWFKVHSLFQEASSVEPKQRMDFVRIALALYIQEGVHNGLLDFPWVHPGQKLAFIERPVQTMFASGLTEPQKQFLRQHQKHIVLPNNSTSPHLGT